MNYVDEVLSREDLIKRIVHIYKVYEELRYKLYVADATIEVENKYTYEDEYSNYETDTFMQLCEEMAIQRDLIDINNRWEITYMSNNESIDTVQWSFEDLLYMAANSNVIKISGRLNKYQKALLDMAILLNDNELNIEFVE